MMDFFSINIFIKVFASLILFEFHRFGHKRNLFDITSSKHSCVRQGIDPEKKQIF